MKSTRALLLSYASVSLLALGCGEDVGTCDDPNKGHDTVVYADSVQFGGQAIINVSCAGCHGSQLKGEARRGAPAGLDFDLEPIPASMAEGDGKNSNEFPIVKISEAQASGLRERQRLVFEERELIWDQVKEGLMPPSGLGKAYRELKNIFDSDDAAPCQAIKPYDPITEKRSQDVLRNWLACGAPIVESQGPVVQKDLTAGKAGYQYKMCTPSEAPMGTITLDVVQEKVMEVACVGCHSAGGTPPDLSSADKTYAFFTNTTDDCNGKKWLDLTGKTLEQSYLHELVTKDKPGCTSTRMPQTGRLTDAQLKTIEGWITAGAPKQ